LAKIIDLFTCPDKGLPMEPVAAVRAIAGVGLENDRYALGTGAYSGSRPQKIRHVSIMAIEGLDLGNRQSDTTLAPIDTRRNVFIRGLDPDALLALIGRRFDIGEVQFRGACDCKPCERPAMLAKKKSNFATWPLALTGIRAEILSDGLIRLCDELVLVD